MTFRVLVDDDEAVTGNVHALVLEAAGYDVELLTDPAMALDAMVRRRPDIVVMDLYMPGVGGWELLPRIRRDYGAAELPVVVVSSETNPSSIEAMMGLGASRYMHKPVAPADLLAVVAQLLHGDSSARGAAWAES